MRRIIQPSVVKSVFLLTLSLILPSFLLAQANPQDTIPNVQTRFPLPKNDVLKSGTMPIVSGIHLPSKNVSYDVQYDILTGMYKVQKMVGNMKVGMPRYMSVDDYRKFDLENAKRQHWQQKVANNDSIDSDGSLLKRFLNPSIEIDGFDRIFGSNKITIKPSGAAELSFGVNISNQDNPSLEDALRTTTTFDFREKIQMGVTGEIGTKMKVGITYNTEATFDFENQTKVGYTGDEDEIIQSIEAGNVSLPLNGTLINGGQNLFGIKTALKFGRLKLTSVLSQQRSETQRLELKGGAMEQNFEIQADEYDDNRHFFLAHYFRDNFDNAMAKLPILQSSVVINRIEVWVTNKTGNFEEARNVLGVMDLGEQRRTSTATYPSPGYIGEYTGNPLPINSANNLYKNLNNIAAIRDINQVSSALSFAEAPGLDFKIGSDYEKIQNARRLSESEFTLNQQLGYISLNSKLNADEVLAVAFEYTYNGETYKVGEFSNDTQTPAPQTLILKMLKGASPTPKLPMWDLMMKNIYSIGAYQLQREDFMLNIMFRNDKTGKAINYIPEGQKVENGGINGKVLLRVMNLDRLNSTSDPQPDGVFDFLEGATVFSQNGRIIFPNVEPFGQNLANQFADRTLAAKYAFYELYDSTQTVARQMAEKNKFYLAGSYQSSNGAEIQLNAMNVQQGSITVTAAGRKLEENVDYSVDYALGRVTILDQGLLQSGTPIQVSFEDNTLFSIQTRTLIGVHADYEISDDFVLGGTVMHLSEKPLTNKVNIGSEPISNTIWGIDGRYRTEAPWLTRMVDKIPFIETKAMSSIALEGEFAQLIPGTAPVIGQGGTAYIDDFEGSRIGIDMKSQVAWVLASTPQGQTTSDMFPETDINADANDERMRQFGYNRAKLAWYITSPDLLRDRSSKPGHINDDDQSDHLVREVYEQDIFPFRESANGIPTTIPVLNLAYYPDEKGPYNYDVAPTSVSSGTDANGKLNDPDTRWGGIMRNIRTNDFEAQNIEFVEFWMMDPFVNDQNPEVGKGDNAYLYLNLGNISEDILKDSRKAWENGLPRDAEVVSVDSTTWGRVPTQQFTVHAFDNNPSSRQYQDVGLDGLSDEEEKSYFSDTYLKEIEELFGANSEFYRAAQNDPSSDNYHYFRGSDYDAQQLSILDRYKNFNGLEGNSPTSAQSPESYPTSSTLLPDIEDINQDNTLSETEGYFQYKIRIHPSEFEVGKNFITDARVDRRERKNGETTEVTWYQFKVPIYNYEKKVGAIEDFRSIRFMRLFLKGFDESVVLRFAKFDLVRGEWRKYLLGLDEAREGTQNDLNSETSFDISAVNIEENGQTSDPNEIPYVLPPGINRVTDPTNPQMQQLNEQSIVLRVGELENGDARAAFRNLDLDMRRYGRLQMEVHAEKFAHDIPLEDGDLRVFIRLGADYQQNYYEYEIPLEVTLAEDLTDDPEKNRSIVWPESNRFDFKLDIFPALKLTRNKLVLTGNETVRFNTPYSENVGNHQISVVGSPSLSNVRIIMIGIRNPSASAFSEGTDTDDGFAKSGEIWLNELRMSDFDESGGWAANGRLTTKLADFATLSLAANTMKPGFGSIESKVSERNMEDIRAYDFSASMDFGKFFPKHNGVKLPVYVGYSESFKDPEFNPLDPDVKMEDIKSGDYPEEEKELLLRQTRDYTRRKAINVTNAKIQTFRSKKAVEKRKKEGKANVTHPLSISNFSVSYNYSELKHYDINTELDRAVLHNGAFNYIWNYRGKPIQPMRKVRWLRSPWLRLIKDFNFYPLPNQLMFRTNIERSYQETHMRNVANPDLIIEPIYQKRFNWTREYGLRYNVSRALKIDLKATNLATIDEPVGSLNPLDEDYTFKRDSIIQNVQDLGRTTQYSHQLNATYNVPINKIPLLNWVSGNARYTANLNWTTSPQTPEAIALGNRLKNNQTIQGSLNTNWQNLYNKVPYLKKVNRRFKSNASANKKKKYKTVKWEQENLKLKEKRRKTYKHKLGTKSVKVRVVDAVGKVVDGTVSIIDDNKISFRPKATVADAKMIITGKKEERPAAGLLIGDGILNLAMALKNASATYSENNGTLVPGYMPRTEYFGLMDVNGQMAPGWPFVLGWQDPDFGFTAAQNGWLSVDTLQTQALVFTHQKRLNLRATLEPLPGLRIDLMASRTFSRDMNSQFLYNPTTGTIQEQNQFINGTFQTTFNSLPTAFSRLNDKNYQSEIFELMKSYRSTIADRLAAQRTVGPDGQNYNPNQAYTDEDMEQERQSHNYPYGYSPNSRQILIPAFIAAYTKKSPDEVSLSAYPNGLTKLNIPFPNWNIKYNGLAKLPGLKKIFKKITLAHGYSSQYAVGNYRIDQHIHDGFYGEDGLSYYQEGEQFVAENIIQNITVSERFSPLISIDLGWEFGLTTKFESRKSRNITLSLGNSQLTEMLSDELVFGLGWRIQELPINIKVGGKTSGFKSDLNIRADYSMRDNMTVIHKLEDNSDQITAGQRNTSIKFSADYNLSERFNLRFYYDQVISNPRVSTSWRTSNTQVGFSLRFTLI